MVMKVCSADFTSDAVALYLSDPKDTFEGVGKDLGISRETLRNWVRAERVPAPSSGQASTPAASPAHEPEPRNPPRRADRSLRPR